jgi:cyanophycin synthetase
MNLFDLGSFHALVDYAHNPASYEALAGFVKNWPGRRLGVVGGPGDRRDEDFDLLGRLSADMFDEIIVKEDDDTRGRPRGEAADLILDGIEAAATDCRYESILEETRAINIALDEAPEGSLVVILPESVSRALQLIEERGGKPTSLHQSPANTEAENQAEPAPASSEANPEPNTSTGESANSQDSSDPETDSTEYVESGS